MYGGANIVKEENKAVGCWNELSTEVVPFTAFLTTAGTTVLVGSNCLGVAITSTVDAQYGGTCWTFTYCRASSSARNMFIPSGGSRYYVFPASAAVNIYIGNSLCAALLDYKAEANNVTY